MYLGGAIAICFVHRGPDGFFRGTLNTAPLTNIFWAIISLTVDGVTTRSPSSF